MWVMVVWQRELGMLANWTDILDGEIVNAAWTVAQMVVKPRTARRTATDLETASWADTERLIKAALAEIPTAPDILAISDTDITNLETTLKRHEVQGALQALLAVRLTDAPETDATRAREILASRVAAREAVRLAVGASLASDLPDLQVPSGMESVAAGSAEKLSEYLDDRISALVARLEGKVGFAGLAPVRAEAYNSRIVALLGAIERQVAALSDPGHGGRAEAEFLDRYRRQVRDRHGKIEPPDFERRRRVPVEKIYVNTSVYAYNDHRVDFGWTPPGRSSISVMDLATRLDRTVLLGDPGGGKTTATSVLAYHFACDTAHKIPFLVTLRHFAAKEPIEHSVAGHIEQTLKTLYQCGAPEGLVERMLVTGRAIVIFDGLDELLDTTRRRDVSERVEQFCSAYPLTSVLVTSRVVGYDQARLDDEKFTCYRLGGFGDDEVTEYVSRWFAAQDDFSPMEADSEAQAFLIESAGAPDLRFNPLLLSLMCILYRGEGSLPRDRPGIYGRCAELLLGKWDERRKIHHELQAGHLVEPAIRHLAWWLFNSDDSRAAVTERILVHETTNFLYGRGPESEEEAWTAAKEFVQFCSGRMWVFSDAGTTAYGEKLYAFTHRTFLEYFAAAHLATASDTPEDLAHALAPHVRFVKGWNLVSELAIQIKDRNSDRGADRIYAVLLDPEVAPGERGPLLMFLAECLESTRPSPTTLRSLTRALLDYRITGESPLVGDHPLRLLLSRRRANYQHLVADEISNQIAAMVRSTSEIIRTEGLRLALEIGEGNENPFWTQWSRQQAAWYAREIAAEATRSNQLRILALRAHIISIEQALSMPGGLSSLMQIYSEILSTNPPDPYPVSLILSVLQRQIRVADPIRELAAIGRYLSRNPDLPWATGTHYDRTRIEFASALATLPLDELSGLGCAAVYAIYYEIFNPHAIKREPLYRIPMPPYFRSLFQDWTKGKANFVKSQKK
jgi:hypothetical protein